MGNSRLRSMRMADADWNRIAQDAKTAGFNNPNGDGNVTGYLIQVAGMLGGWEPETQLKGRLFTSEDIRELLEKLNLAKNGMSVKYIKDKMNRFAFAWCEAKGYLWTDDKTAYITEAGQQLLN